VRVAAIIVAAGRGERFGGLKQFAQVNGESITARSVRNARSVASFIVVVVPESYDGDGEGADETVCGGSQRSDSVRAGLARCGDYDVVLVHDAARPLASPALFARVLDPVAKGASAAIPGLPVTDTVKQTMPMDDQVIVERTVAREHLVTVQTPQAFRRDVLVRAHEGNPQATDDAGLVERLGERVVVVDGERFNVKITEFADLEYVSQGVQ
jgi:2-C-methyl-D-erythritol 4-phosphate cytidylyltransferase